MGLTTTSLFLLVLLLPYTILGIATEKSSLHLGLHDDGDDSEGINQWPLMFSEDKINSQSAQIELLHHIQKHVEITGKVRYSGAVRSGDFKLIALKPSLTKGSNKENDQYELFNVIRNHNQDKQLREPEGHIFHFHSSHTQCY
mmetsp:Transcript_52929/g.67867  ORF Transcript_52929/g.67867 Transcript_52929/m.67867 type:complete len:143 (-) Transcript_52929:548-976(-)